MVDTSKLSDDQRLIVIVEIEFLLWCVKHTIITVEEYMEMSDCYLYPFIKQQYES
jgi:hypothetical protein